MTKSKYLFLLTLILLLVGCSQDSSNSSFTPAKYNGSNLIIGVVGEKPLYNDEKVTFKNLTIEDIRNESFYDLDGVIITKSKLEEASEPAFANIYINSPVPFIFADSEKVLHAFIDEHTSYKDALTIKSGDYLTGYFNNHTFGLTLHEDIANEKSLEDVYARVFKLIEHSKETKELNI